MLISQLRFRAPFTYLAILFGSFSGLNATAADGVVVRPNASVANASQGVWSVRWWQWASSFEYAESPLSDMTGTRCGAGQEGSVWFLAGVYGSAPVKRRCDVPAGKHLFFPIVNYMVSANPNGTSNCEIVTRTAKELTDEATDLTLIIDDKEVSDLKKFRQVSPTCFNLGERVNQDISPTAANGYFVMLNPLLPGRHVIKWGGRLPSIRQAVIYEITVVDRAL